MDRSSPKFSIEDSYRNLERTIGWVGNCDSKTSIILSFYGIVITIILSSDFISKILEVIKLMVKNFTVIRFIILLIMFLSVLCCLMGIFHLLYVLLPKNNKKFKETKEEDSLIYFFTIANNNSFNEYDKKLSHYTEEDLQHDINMQVYINSKICKIKFDNYSKGLMLSTIGALSFVAFFIIGLLIN